MKNKRGITLIALIITIIILLILAGITITSLTNSSLFEQAKEAKQRYENVQEEEEKILNDYNDYISGTRNNNYNNYLEWPENAEVKLGNNMYGYRFTGICTGNYYRQDYKCMDTGKKPHIIDYGGQIDVSTGDTNKISAQGYIWSTSDYLIPCIVSFQDTIRMQVTISGDHANVPYDIWVIYAK